MKAIHWFEAKQLDRVTNYSSRTECIKHISEQGHPIYYYCSFYRKKEYYGLNDNIKYLAHFRNKYLKFLEFHTLTLLKSLQLCISSDNNVLMVNQDLVINMIPAACINKILGKNNKFVLDVRTLPTTPEAFEKKMKRYRHQLKLSINYFDGLSFITPFLEKVSLIEFKNKQIKTVNWSSGVNISIFDAKESNYKRDTDAFRLFYHGGISISRGNLDLIKACEKVVNQGYKIELIQIGKIVNNEIREYIKEQKIEAWCKLYDAKPLKEMPQLIAQCDLPVLPFPNFMAWRVSSPIKLMEYMAMGKPVLVPNMECFSDLFPQDCEMAYYYDLQTNNVIDNISNAIIRRINNHKNDLNFENNQKCIEYVSRHFTWSAQANNLLEFCIKLCQKVN